MYINKLYITCTEVYFKSNYLFFGVVSKYSWLAVQEMPVISWSLTTHYGTYKHSGGVMVSMLASRVEDLGSSPGRVIPDYKIGICCFFVIYE